MSKIKKYKWHILASILIIIIMFANVSISTNTPNSMVDIRLGEVKALSTSDLEDCGTWCEYGDGCKDKSGLQNRCDPGPPCSNVAGC